MEELKKALEEFWNNLIQLRDNLRWLFLAMVVLAGVLAIGLILMVEKGL